MTVSQTAEIRNTRAESFRLPIDCAVDLRPAGGEWRRKSATNISMSGMFIRTTETYPKGAELEIKFDLQNGQPSIRGRAEVLWCRARKAGPEQPRGIGVRFLDLDLESKYAISRLVDRYRQLVRMPFQISLQEESEASSPGSGGRHRGALALAFLAGLTAGALGSFWLIAGSGRAEREGAGVAEASEVARESEESPLAPSLEDSRLAQRSRLARPGHPQVSLSAFEIEIGGPDRAVARFDQTYSAPDYRDRVRKELVLSRRDGEWKILREEILAKLPAG